MKKKFKTILALSLSSAVLVGSVSTFVGVYYTASNDNVYVSPRIDSSPTYDQDLGYLDSKISDSLSVQPLITNVVSNQYGAQQSFKSVDISEISNISFYKYKDEDNVDSKKKDPKNLESQNISDSINEENLQKDIFYSFQKAFNDNQKIRLTLSSDSIKYADNKLSFNYVLNVKKLDAPISFSFNNISFLVPQGNNFDITFKVDSQPISLKISGSNIYWSVSNVDILINGKSINELKTVLTFNSQINSYSIPYQFTNLTTENDYKETIKDTSNKSAIDVTSLKQQIYNHIQKNKDLSFTTIDLLSKIFKKLENNPSVSNFLSDLSSDFANYLVKIELLPEGSEPIITSFLKNEKTTTEIIDTYKDKISDIVIEFLPTEYKSLINKEILTTYIIPSLLNNDPSITSLINDFVPSEFAPLVNKILTILSNSSTKPLDFIKSILESDELSSFMNTDDELAKYKPVINLLKALFANQNQTVLKVLTNNKKILVDIINMLMTGPNGQQGSSSQILKMFITDNSNFNETNLLELFKLTLSPLATFMSDRNNYDIIEDSKDKWTQDLTVDENNRYSFTYKMSIKFKSKNSGSDNVFAINFKGFDKISPSYIQAFWSVYFIDTATIKANDQINWTFSASNQDLVYSPVKQNDGNYYSGYVTPFNFNLRLNMPGLFNSISTQYQRYFAFGGDGVGYSFIKSVFISFLLPDYDFYESFNYVDLNKPVENYNESLYIPDIVYTMNTNYDTTKVESYISYSQVNQTKLTFKGFWGIGNVNENISGNKPKVDKKEELLRYLYPEYDSWMKLPKELQPVISVISTVNGYASMAGSLNITFGIKILNISIQFPYKIYNKDKNKFENSFTTTISM